VRWHSPLLCAALVALLASCSGIEVNSDWDPAADWSGMRTWAWISPQPAQVIAPPGQEGNAARFESPLAQERIQAAIEDELRTRGYRKIESGTPDFYVGYEVALDREIDADTVYRGYGIAPYSAWGGDEVYIRQYDVGTLLINVVRAQPRALVWRGWGQSRLQELKTPAEREARVRDVVSRVLDRFPPRS
jgi:hypothetical protein